MSTVDVNPQHQPMTRMEHWIANIIIVAILSGVGWCIWTERKFDVEQRKAAQVLEDTRRRTWEDFPGPSGRVMQRLRVPGGWLVQNSAGGLTYIHDAVGEWKP